MQMATGLEWIAYKLTLLKDWVQTFEKANEALLKHQRAKCIRIQEGGICTRDTVEVLIAEKKAKRLKQQKMSLGGGNVEAGPVTQRCYSNCSKTSHNVRTCQEVEETLDEGSYIVSD